MQVVVRPQGLATMAGMDPGRVTLHQMPPLVRLWLTTMLMLGILVMHGVVTSADDGAVAHHESMPTVQGSAAVMGHAAESVSRVAGVAQVGELGGVLGTSLAHCGGLGALCLAMIIGLSAFVVLRRRTLDRVPWQLPPPMGTRRIPATAPFPSMSPRERSSILRC